MYYDPSVLADLKRLEAELDKPYNTAHRNEWLTHKYNIVRRKLFDKELMELRKQYIGAIQEGSEVGAAKYEHRIRQHEFDHYRIREYAPET